MGDIVKNVWKFIKDKGLLSYIIIILIVILVRSFIVTPIRVNGTSMDPNLSDGEIMILKKYDKSYDRFDIVVVNKSVEGNTLIKRVIGLPNETIEYKDGKLYINGKKMDDPFGYGETEDFKEIKLKNNEYFVMGDNREVSKDSRILGGIFSSELEGTTNLVIFPFKKAGTVD